jgi:hypothetical protein
MKPVALTLVAVAAAVAAPTAGATLTKAQVIQRGSAICKAGERKVDALPQIRSQHPFAANAPKGDATRAIRFLAGYADALEGVRAGLAKLSPPPQGRALLEGFVADLRPTVAAFRAAHADAVERRYGAAEAEAQRGFVLFAKASKKTAAYGFPKGVCQSGSS